MVERVRRDLWTDRHDHRLFPQQAGHDAACRGGLYHGGLLVHGVDVLRQPGVTLARAASNTFAGIRPADAPGFILAQLAGAAAATLLFTWLYPAPPANATVGGTVAPGDFADQLSPH
jgi:hypothetical protein